MCWELVHVVRALTSAGRLNMRMPRTALVSCGCECDWWLGETSVEAEVSAVEGATEAMSSG